MLHPSKLSLTTFGSYRSLANARHRNRCRVVERPHVGDRALYTHLLEVIVEMVNLRLGGALRRKWRTIGWKRAGKVMWKADTFKVVAPACVG
jgi:hypothetical protein